MPALRLSRGPQRLPAWRVAMGCERSWFERNPRKTFAAFYSFLLLLLCLIDVFFALHTRENNEHRRDIERSYRIKSPISHHDLAPNKSIQKVQWGERFYSVKTNSLGFRDRRVREIDITSKYYRILFIGDSFTEGLGVEYENTFVGLIETALSADGIDVLNASSVSYSPIMYLTKVSHIVKNVKLRFNELIVFLDISDIQDEAVYYDFDENRYVVDNEVMLRNEVARGYHHCSHRNQGKTIDRYLEKMKRFTILSGAVINSIEILSTDRNHFFRKHNCATNLRRSMWTLDDDLYDEYGRVGLEKAEEHLDGLLSLLENRAIKLTIAVCPWPDQIINRDINSRQVSFWQNWADEHKVTFLNYFPYFIDGSNAEEVLNAYFIPGDVHLNEMGHQHIANIFLLSFA
jgi:hypothetical protein